MKSLSYEFQIQVQEWQTDVLQDVGKLIILRRVIIRTGLGSFFGSFYLIEWELTFNILSAPQMGTEIDLVFPA